MRIATERYELPSRTEQLRQIFLNLLATGYKAPAFHARKEISANRVEFSTGKIS